MITKGEGEIDQDPALVVHHRHHHRHPQGTETPSGQRRNTRRGTKRKVDQRVKVEGKMTAIIESVVAKKRRNQKNIIAIIKRRRKDTNRMMFHLPHLVVARMDPMFEGVLSQERR